MHCETCQADVAAEISADGKSLICTTCGGEIQRTDATSLSDEAQSARDLLERWSKDELLDPYGPDAGSDGPSAPESSVPRRQPPRPKFRVDAGSAGPPRPASAPSDPTLSNQGGSRPDPRAARSQPKFRIDARHEQPPASLAGRVADRAHADAANQAGGFDGGQPPAEPPEPWAEMPDGYRIDAAQTTVPAPHFSMEAFAPPSGPRPGRFESLAGQLLAYGGTALLTVGTALVLYGYFGGGEQLTANGWLVATIGQMLLFLGVVTLISGGMQQTTHEVGSRVQYLGERLIRLESSQPLRGPHYARATSDQRVSVSQEQRRDADQQGEDTGSTGHDPMA